MQKHNIKLTNDRITDFRVTMQEIVDLKNGIIPFDYIDEDFLNHAQPTLQNNENKADHVYSGQLDVRRDSILDYG